MSQLDKLSIAKTANMLGTLLNNKFGIFKTRNWLYEDSSVGWSSTNDKNFILGIGHHMGTTRMSHNKNSGVVDINCKMHGLSNLYIAGSSVFPTGGYVNPTLTIVALSLRLANHLKKLIKC
jgi:choline dehydrogenase-like flavoprotein